MSYFKDPNGKLHFLDNEDFAHLLPEGCTPISDDDAATLQVSLAATALQLRQVEARAALDKTDMVAMRCMKAGVPYPAAWMTYTTALRAIISATGDAPALPSQPAFPKGT